MADSHVDKWRRWIEDSITPEVHGIYLHRATYKRIQEIVVADERLPRDAYFWEYLDDPSCDDAGRCGSATGGAQRARALAGKLLKEVAIGPGPDDFPSAPDPGATNLDDERRPSPRHEGVSSRNN
jgi:hypothetical protein